MHIGDLTFFFFFNLLTNQSVPFYETIYGITIIIIIKKKWQWGITQQLKMSRNSNFRYTNEFDIEMLPDNNLLNNKLMILIHY